jgi:hypothetical protein
MQLVFPVTFDSLDQQTLAISHDLQNDNLWLLFGGPIWNEVW